MLSRIDESLKEIERKLLKQIILEIELNTLKMQLEGLQTQIDKLQASPRSLELPLLAFQNSKTHCEKLFGKVVKMLAVCHSGKPLISPAEKKIDVMIDIREEKKGVVGNSTIDVLIDDLLRLVLRNFSVEEMHRLRKVSRRFNQIVPTVNITAPLVPIQIPGVSVIVTNHSIKKNKKSNSTVAQLVSRVGLHFTPEEKALTEDAVVLEMRRRLYARCSFRGYSAPFILLMSLAVLAYIGGAIAVGVGPNSHMSPGAMGAFISASVLLLCACTVASRCHDRQNETNLPDLSAGVASLITRLGVRKRLTQFTSVASVQPTCSKISKVVV